MSKLPSYLFILILITLFAYQVKAATIKGRIIADDGEPLGFATVLVKGTTIGTSANAEGYYSFSLPEGEYILLAQYIGYKQSTYVLKISSSTNNNIVHDFTLQMQGYELKDLVVKSGGKDPAYRIIRNAIKQRNFHLKQSQSFQSNIYVKGVLRNRETPNKIMGRKVDSNDKKEMGTSMGLDSLGRGVLYLAEEVADFYQQGKKQKVVIQSVKESGNPNGFGMGSVPPVINFYENNVNVMVSAGANELGFVSPISEQALSVYKYKLEGGFVENERYIFKIKVIPKRNFERCFVGDIYISDDDWAIHSLNLLLTNKQGLDLLDTIRTTQQYIPLKKDIWVIKNQVFFITLKFLGFDISGDFATVYNNQKINEPIPDSIFNNKIKISYNAGATKRDSNYWKNIRPIALAIDEDKNYQFKDSVYEIENDPKRVDSLRKIANKVHLSEFFWGGISINSKEYKRRFSISQALTDINFNTVEGLNYSPILSYRQKIDSNKILQIESHMRYGFSNTHFNAKGKIQFVSQNKNWRGKKWQLTLSGGKYIAQLNPNNPVAEFYNSYASLVQQKNYFKIFEHWLAGFQVKRTYGNGFLWSVSALYEDRNSLQNTSNYSFVRNRPKASAYSDNLPPAFSSIGFIAHQAFTTKLLLQFQPGIHYVQFPEYKVAIPSEAPIFSLQYQKGIKGIAGSSTDFDRLDFQIQDNVNFKRLGSLDYLIQVGGFLNNKNVPIPDRKQILGNQFNIAAPYLQSFQLAPFYQFSSTDNLYGSLHFEYFLKGIISNKVPLFRQAHWYFVLGNNTFYTQQKQYYTEAFVGLDNLGYKIFRGFRIDFIKGWDNTLQQYSGFRLGYKMGNSVKINLGNANKSEVF